MNNTVYSFSRLKLFNECPHAYFLTYIMKSEKMPTIYSEIGTTIHDLLEKIQEGEEISTEQRLKEFEDKVEECEMFGIEFVNNNIKERYVANIEHCLRNFKQLQGESFEIEKEIELNIGEYKLTGFVDCIIHHNDGTVSVIDFKTSSKYSKKDLDKNANQLIIYGIGLEQLGYKIRDIKWYMLKYATVKSKRGNKIIERRELEDEQEYEECFIDYPYNDITKMECINWIEETIEKIESMNINDKWENKEINKGTSFYCQNICSVCGKCEALKQFKKDFKNFNR